MVTAVMGKEEHEYHLLGLDIYKYFEHHDDEQNRQTREPS